MIPLFTKLFNSSLLCSLCVWVDFSFTTLFHDFHSCLNNPCFLPSWSFDWYWSKVIPAGLGTPFVKSFWVWRMVSFEVTVGQCVEWSWRTGQRSAPREQRLCPQPAMQLPHCSDLLIYLAVFLCPVSVTLLVPKHLLPSWQGSIISNEGQAVHHAPFRTGLPVSGDVTLVGYSFLPS